MISITILSKNNQNTIKRVLESTRSFDEVIVLDTGSTDNTLSICRDFDNVKIFHSSFCGFGELKNQAASLAKNDWILSIDSDEILSKKLIEEIHHMPLNDQMVYAIRRRNYFNGKQILHCGWDPQYVTRLYHRKMTSFESNLVHEGVIIGRLKKMRLKNGIDHFPYLSIDDLLTKMQLYTSLFAEQNAGKKRSSFAKALFHGMFAFFRSFLFQGGIFGGKESFILSLYQGHISYYKYLKLALRNKSDNP